MKKKLLFGLTFLLCFFLLVGNGFAVKPAEWNINGNIDSPVNSFSYSKFDKKKGQTEMLDRENNHDTIFNNQVNKSWSYRYMKDWFRKYRKQYSNSRGGLRLGPVYSVWFNNIAPSQNSNFTYNKYNNSYVNLQKRYNEIWDFNNFEYKGICENKNNCDNKYTAPDTFIISDGNGKIETIKKGDRLTESQCFYNFINIVIKNKDYFKDKKDSFDKWLGKKGAGKGNSSLGVKKDKYKMFEGTDVNSFEDYFQKISTINFNTLDNEKVWWLQTAINIIQCDTIMIDGKLGNYTIKSFCECNKPELKCLEVKEEIPTKENPKLGRFKFKENQDISSLGNNLNSFFSTEFVYKEHPVCNISGKVKNNLLFSVENFDFGCKLKELGLDGSKYLPICCPADTSRNDKYKSCCIEPTIENIQNKCLNSGQILNDKAECGPGTEHPGCLVSKNPDKEIPFCPCSAGGKVKIIKKDNNTYDTECGCIENPNTGCRDEFYNIVNGDFKQVTGVKILSCGAVVSSESQAAKSQATHCKGKVNGLITRICPCEGNKGKKEIRTREPGKKDFECPCVENPKDCDNFKEIEEGTKCGPNTKNIYCEKNKKKYPICPCGKNEKEPRQFQNGKRQCPECEDDGESFDFEKEKCVCDPNKQCCGLKLNTNVPWIGRCIEFGATNDTHKTVTNEYGDGNTTITVNSINAFAVLMSALGKILMTVFFLAGFGMLIYAGTLIASGSQNDGKDIIKKVAIGVALVGASGIILHMINPNFFL